jgi:hypothetical protein
LETLLKPGAVFGKNKVLPLLGNKNYVNFQRIGH